MGSQGPDKYEKIVELAKRRGFFWPSFEIYGGVAGFYDLGPLGTLLKNNIVQLWKEYFVIRHMDMVVEVETPVITPKVVFEASGHLQHFTDPIVECLSCKRKFRADQLIEEALKIKVEGKSVEELTKMIRDNNIKCPICGGDLGDVRVFNLLFQTFIGPYTQNTAFLRPEAAQGMFTSFKRVHTVMREKLPLGIAQVGRVARNEISPRQGMVRLREFTIMEVEFFFDPEDPGEPPFSRFGGKLRILTADAKIRGEEKPEVFDIEEAVEEGVVKNVWLAYWMAVAREFVKELGVPEDNMFFEEKLPHERAHYATQTFDQLVRISRWGWIEVSGHAYRGDYDLSGHMKYSGQDLTVFKKFDKPIVKKMEKVIVDKAIIGKLFREKSGEILKSLRELSVDVVKKALAEGKSHIEVNGFKVPLSAIEVRVIEEKVAGRKFVPHVVEPSFGAERLVLVVLDHAYTEEEDRVILKIPPKIAPVKLAVFPLVTKEPLIKIAKEIFYDALAQGLTAIYDDSGSIGRRYARADEIGIPYAVTVDYQTLEDRTVTIRERDTRTQIRVGIDEVIGKIKELTGFTR
ncbi:MAG: glycine--tRNA ligase [Desulfurococcales archaeon]|nr:glycine--tRNA ligase [Desulfurococcales archaeon]